MSTEKEKVEVRIEELKDFLPNEKKEELAKILEFGEKYKKEGDEMEGKFWKEHNRDEFLNLISQYEESKQNFIKRLPPEEKEILDSLKGKSREKFYKEYLQEIILYRGDLERNSNDSDNNEIKISGYGDKVIEEIKNVKGKFKPKMEIGLGWKNIGNEGAKLLAGCWKDSLQPGMKIILYSNNIGSEGAKLLAEERKDSLQPGMGILLCGNNIGDEGLRALTEGWKNSLQPGMEIGLGTINIGEEGVKYLAEGRKNSLQPGMEINLEVNNIGEEGVKYLAEGWKNSLQPGMEINLHNNNIRDKGLKALAEEWKESLQPGMIIDLRDNKIGDEGVKALAEEWKESLQPGMQIGLWENNIGDDGVQAIMDKLELKDGVVLNLTGNNISDEKKEELKAWEKKLKNRGINCEVYV